MKKHEHIVSGVVPGSIAEELEIGAGDKLLAVDGHEIEDIFDYQFYTYYFTAILKRFSTVTFTGVKPPHQHVKVVPLKPADATVTVSQYFTETPLRQPFSIHQKAVTIPF